MTHGSLFSGIGGFDLAAQWAGWENKFHCELNPFGRKVLNYYWPESESYADITKTDFTIWRGRIDVLSGGFPCQPYSKAGSRKGTEDDRYLWPEMRRAYQQIRPTIILGENVTGILSMEDKSGNAREVFAKVESRNIIRYSEIDHYEAVYTRQAEMLVSNICKDLEEDGYEAQTFAIPAAGVGAPHRRERIFFLAYCNSPGLQTERAKQQTAGVEQYRKLVGNVADTDSNGHQQGGPGENRQAPKKSQSKGNKRERVRDDNRGTGEQGVTAHTTKPNKQRNRVCQKCKKRKVGRCDCIEDVTHTNSGERPERGVYEKGRKESERHAGTRNACGHERGTWDQFPTQSPVCGGNDGISSGLVGITVSKHRKESLMAYGNGVVPQVVYQFFDAINKLNKERRKVA